MKLLRTIVYPGPNRWSRASVVEAQVELEESNEDQALVLSQLVLRLHREAGVVANAILPAATDVPTIFLLPFEFEAESLLRECLATALRLVAKLQPSGSQAIDICCERRRLLDFADQVRLGPSSRAILRAAAIRGIPFQRLNQGSLIQLGEGAHQRRIWTAETDRTSAIAESIASDKQLTRSLLAAVGIQVPQGRSVTDREDAWRAAQEMGLPVVVKPRNGNHACGVSLDLGDQEAVLNAYDWACKVGSTSEIIVEQFVPGDHHRLLVVGGKLVAAAKAHREYVVGDGIRSIAELVDELNRDPRRGENYTDPLDIVQLNDAAAIVLRRQGLTIHSIPSRDRKVLISPVGDLIEDCTALVHPATRRDAILAAQVIGLDIAGMDVVATDISRPLAEQRGCMIEVNAGPSLSPHVAPLIGSPQPVGEAIVELLFPDELPATVPTVLVVRDSRPGGIAMSLATVLGSHGFRVGIASDSGPAIGSCRDGSIWPLACNLDEYRGLLIHPAVSAIVIECSAEHIAAQGLACSHAEYVIVPDWFSSDEVHSSPAVTATLDTLRHLVANQGCILVTCKRPLDPQTVSDKSGVPGSRIRIFASDEQVLNCICDELQSVYIHCDCRPASRRVQRQPATRLADVS